MTNIHFLTRYEKVIQDFFDKGGWKGQNQDDYLDEFEKCKSDYKDTFEVWTSSNKRLLDSIAENCRFEPIMGINTLIKMVKDKM